MKGIVRAVAGIALALALSACGTEAQEADPTASSSPAASSAPATTESPAFDCSAASNDVERMVCETPDLAALDRRLDDLYQQVLADRSGDKANIEATQRGWIEGRDDCWKDSDVPRCVTEAYQTRLVELQVDRPGSPVPPTVDYRCGDNDTPVTGVFYNDIDPRSMMLTVGNDQAILIQQPTGSGIRYSREGAEYSEHQGEVSIDFYGMALTCSVP